MDKRTLVNAARDVITTTGICQHITKIAEIGRSRSGSGYTRLAFSPEETAVMDYLSSVGQKEGLFVEQDEFGNRYISLVENPLHRRTFFVGSHADTVPNGGNYDGIVGIVGGLEALKAIKRIGFQPEFNVSVVIWRGEESSRFKVPYIGSRCAFGVLDPEVLKYEDSNGITLEHVLVGNHYDIEAVAKGEGSISPDLVEAYLELHIEQARDLEHSHLDMGIVNSIRGYERLRVRLYGEPDHSGATPMELRSSTTRAFAHMYHAIEREGWRRIREKQEDIVWDVTMIQTGEDAAINIVPDYLEFYLDIRGYNKAALNGFVEYIRNIVSQYSPKNNISAEISTVSQGEPIALLDDNLKRVGISSCRDLGYSYKVMPSGAGHDGMIIAGQQRSDDSAIPVGMRFIPCRLGRSHRPEEYSSPEQIFKGTFVLLSDIVSYRS